MLHMMKDDLLTTGQIADEGGVHRTTVGYWVRTKKLRVAKVANGIRLFRRSDVEKLLEKREAVKS